MRAAEESLLRGALSRSPGARGQASIRGAAAILGVPSKIVRSRCYALGILERRTRRDMLVAIGGASKTVTEWAAESGIPRAIVFKRLERGESGEHLLREARIYKKKDA